MSSPSDEHIPADPHDGIDATDNAEASTYERAQTPALARAAEGAPPSDAPAEDEAPEVAGAGAGDPLAGVHITEQDAAHAVPGDEGPEHGGVRRSS